MNFVWRGHFIIENGIFETFRLVTYASMGVWHAAVTKGLIICQCIALICSCSLSTTLKMFDRRSQYVTVFYRVVHSSFTRTVSGLVQCFVKHQYWYWYRFLTRSVYLVFKANRSFIDLYALLLGDYWSQFRVEKVNRIYKNQLWADTAKAWHRISKIFSETVLWAICICFSITRHQSVW